MPSTSTAGHDLKSLTVVAEKFERLAADLRVTATEMDIAGIPSITVTHQKGLELGLELTTKFCGAAKLAIQNAAAKKGVFKSAVTQPSAGKKRVRHGK